MSTMAVVAAMSMSAYPIVTMTSLMGHLSRICNVAKNVMYNVSFDPKNLC